VKSNLSQGHCVSSEPCLCQTPLGKTAVVVEDDSVGCREGAKEASVRASRRLLVHQLGETITGEPATLGCPIQEELRTIFAPAGIRSSRDSCRSAPRIGKNALRRLSDFPAASA
jgi:hypothetical protein